VILGRGGVFAGAEECTGKEFLEQKLPNVPSSGKYLAHVLSAISGDLFMCSLGM